MQVSKKGKVGGKKKKYVVLTLGVGGNKRRQKKSAGVKRSRQSVFYMATCHFGTWKMDVSLCSVGDDGNTTLEA